MSAVMSTNELQVWGWTAMPRTEWGATTNQVRVIVAAKSRAAAARFAEQAGLGKVTGAYLASWACTTGNELELAVATAAPGRVFWCNEGGGDKIYRVVEF